MIVYVIRRLWQMIPTLAGVMLLIFFLFNFVGGDPAVILAGKIPNPEQIANIRRQLGVDLPYWQQLLIFAKQVATFDFGRSWSTNEEVSKLILTRIGPTLTIMIPVLLIETTLAVILALGVTYVRGTLTDRVVMIVCTVAMSISLLVYIIVGQYYFAFQKGWFPVQGWSDSPWRNLATYAPLPVMLTVLVGIAPSLRLYRTFFLGENLLLYSSLPILILLVVSIAPDLRLFRTFVLDEINQDYVRTARAKGLSERAVVLRHVLRNALIPVLTNMAIYLPGVMVGLFLLERFFSIPGLGREVIVAVERSDFPVIKAVTIYLSIFTMFINLFVDLLYKWADPRIQLK